MIAIIRTGGKQYKVKEGSVLDIEKILGDEGSEVIFNDVLFASDEEGSNVRIGSPRVEGVTVTGTILKQKKGKKVTIIKFKPKVRYRRKKGHRQLLTTVKIEKVLA